MDNDRTRFCPFCGAQQTQSARFCSACGRELIGYTAPQPADMSAPDAVPKTIDELKAWYVARNLPPEETTRFFIGRNILERRAFGIYRETNGDVVVYKNKDDGTRAIRYRGPDEAVGVNELWLRLKQEIGSQKSRISLEKSEEQKKIYRKRCRIAGIVIALMIAAVIWIGVTSPKDGYYRYNDDYYYYSHDTWYVYDWYYEDWDRAYGMNSVMLDSLDDYYLSSGYDSTYGTGSFLSSDYYYDYVEDAWESSSSTWDSGDSWDSGSTDFSSDW